MPITGNSLNILMEIIDAYKTTMEKNPMLFIKIAPSALPSWGKSLDPFIVSLNLLWKKK
jgi:hypothetical protein